MSDAQQLRRPVWAALLPAHRPHDLVQLRACFSALDAYAAAHPGTAWPLVLIDANGTHRPLATLEELLLRYSLNLMPLN